MQLKSVLSIIVLSLLFVSCGSSKKTIKKRPSIIVLEPKPTDLPSVKQIQHVRKLQRKNSNLNKYTLQYIRKYAPIAVREMHKYKIPASVTLAQGILESGSGRSELAVKSNNHFGIKCHKKWRGERVYHDDDEEGECFRKYTYVATSYKDHSAFLSTRKRYSFLFKLGKKNYKAWAKGLKKAGYATDRKYPKKLIKIIKNYRLYEFDKLKWKDVKPSKNKRVFTEKITKTHYVIKKGDTLYSLAKRFETTVETLKKLNNLVTNKLNIGYRLKIK